MKYLPRTSVEVVSFLRSRSRRYALWLAVLVFLLGAVGNAEPIAVRNDEGAARGFLVMRNADGKIIATGDVIQISRGSRVMAHLTFHFRDGSIDEETAVYTDRKTFRLISDHHIQKGPSYPHPSDVLVDARTGMVTVRSTGKDGKPVVTSDHVDLPEDIANGMTLILVKNIPRGAGEIKLPLVIAAPKPRLIKLAVRALGEEPCFIGGIERKAIHYVGKIELGGVAGVVAPIIGKQPEDMNIWVLGGEVPALLRVQGQLFEGGPVWNIEIASPVWPHPTEHGQ